MKMKTLFVDYDLDGQVEIGIQIASLGRSSLTQKISKKEYFKKLFKRHHLLFDKKNIKEEIDKLLDAFKATKNIEIIQKSTIGQEFRNFIKTNLEGQKNYKSINKIAFIARFENDFPKVLQKTQANAIILTFDFIKEVKSIGELFYLKLIDFDIHKIQKLNYKHLNVFKITEGIDFQNFQNFDEPKLLIENQLKDLKIFQNLQKSINVFEELDSLKLLKQKTFIELFYEFLESNKEEALNVYALDNNRGQYFEINEIETSDIALMTKKNLDDNSNSRQSWIISSRSDYSDKVKVKFVKSQKLSLEKIFNDEIKNLDISQTQNETNIESLNSQIVNYESEIETNLKSIDHYENKIQSLKTHKIELELKQNEHQNVLQEIKVTRGELDQKLNQIYKIKNIKDYEHKIKILNTQKQELELENNNLEKKRQMILIEITNVKEKLIQESNQINRLKKLNASMTKNTKDNQEAINNLKKKNRELIEIQKKLAIQKTNSIAEDMNLYKIKVKVVNNDFNANYKKSMGVKSHSMIDCLMQIDVEQSISNFDNGFYFIIKRWKQTYFDYMHGNYKSPYALISLDKPEIPISIVNEPKVKYFQVNDLQQKAINSIHNSHFASFLQGPPGTGKTQVISATILNAIANHENIVLSSSTNEAINNAFDRIFNDTYNPNLFMIRYSKSEFQMKKAPQYTSDALYKSFINNIYKFVESSNQVTVAENFKKFLKKFLQNENFKKLYFPPFKSFQILDFQNIEKRFKDIKHVFKRLEEWENYNEESFYEDIEHFVKQSRKKLLKNFSSEIREIDTFVDKNSSLFSYQLFDTLESYASNFINSKEDETKAPEKLFFRLSQKINRSFNEKNQGYLLENYQQEIKKLTLDFAQKCFDTESINVIGLTTTSRLEIGISNAPKTKELFTNYPVDMAIIDEISKSVTPEILSISKLARKFVFAGDYRQLPPQLDFDPIVLREFSEYIKNYDLSNEDEHVERKMKQFKKAFNPNNDETFPDEKTFEDFKAEIDDLFRVSLFENQVMKMKVKANNEQNSYVALRKQYRFGDAINEIVNLTYDETEKLESNKNDDDFEKFAIGSKRLRSEPVNIIDTTNLTDDFKEKYKINLRSDISSFDSNYSIAINQHYASKINDFNAFVIAKIITNLKEKNPNLKIEDIGVITMTRSQANLITSLLRSSLFKSERLPKIDTVDNFQGREKKLIILDLVRAKNLYDFEKKKIRIGNKRNLKYYESPERINVSVSRAQNKLIIVGAIEYLAKEVTSKVKTNKDESKQIQLFQEWINIVSKKGGFLEWNEF